MVVKIEKFNNVDSLLINMMEGGTRKYSSLKIKAFIDEDLERFSTEHLDELVEALDRDDYDEVPVIPSYFAYRDGQLAPKIREMMQQAEYNNSEIEDMISWGNGHFYTSVLPNVHDKKRKRDGVCVR